MNTVVTTFNILVIVITLWCNSQAQPDEDRILGRWYTENSQAAFDFFRDGEMYKAKLIPLEIPDLKDYKNPVDSLRNRKLYGAVTIYGLIYDQKKQQWLDGKVYNPDDGRIYTCYCYITKNGTLVFRGYIGFPALGKSQVWTRDRRCP
jgi:uncharacterized protein (DUF2147 family)